MGKQGKTEKRREIKGGTRGTHEGRKQERVWKWGEKVKE